MEWLTSSDSVPLRLRYASRYIKRSPSESNFVLVDGCGMQVPPLHASIKSAGDGPRERVPAERVEGGIVRVGPHSQFRIVREKGRVVGRSKSISIICSRCVGSGRNGYAIHVRRNVNRLRQHPPPRCFVILRDGVAAVVCLARSAKTVPQCVSCSRARNEIPGRFVEHREVQVHPLHVLCRTSSAVCIRGRTAVEITVVDPYAHTLKILAGRRVHKWTSRTLQRRIRLRYQLAGSVGQTQSSLVFRFRRARRPWQIAQRGRNIMLYINTYFRLALGPHSIGNA